MFECDDGEDIDHDWTCDGMSDCWGGEDERTPDCPEGNPSKYYEEADYPF